MTSIASDKAGIGDFNITVGNDFSRSIALLDDDTGAALVLTGGTITSTIRRNKYDTSAAAVSGFTVSNSNLTSGTFDISLTDTQTTTLGPYDYWYAIDIDYGGEKFTYLSGILHLTYEATR